MRLTLDAIAERAGLTEREAAVWVAAETGVSPGDWHTIVYGVLPDCVGRKRAAVLDRRRRGVADLLGAARYKVDLAFPGWRGVAMREARSVIACAANRRISDDHVTLAAEAGLREWVGIDSAPSPYLHGQLVSAADLVGDRQAAGIRGLFGESSPRVQGRPDADAGTGA